MKIFPGILFGDRARAETKKIFAGGEEILYITEDIVLSKKGKKFLEENVRKSISMIREILLF